HRMAPRPPTRPVRTPRKRSTPSRSWLAVGAYAGLGLACLLLAAATFLFVAAPVELVRDRLVQQLKASTGRDLLVAGGSSVSFFPSAGGAGRDVSASGPAGLGRPAAPQRGDARCRPRALVAVQRRTRHHPRGVDTPNHRAAGYCGGRAELGRGKSACAGTLAA